MKKAKRILLLAGMLLLFAGCGARTPKETVTKAEGQADVKALIDEFYDGLAEADQVTMTTLMNGETVSVFTKDGDKMRVSDSEGSVFYLFKENGKDYYMAEGEDPVKEDFAYDMYAETIRTNLAMFVTGIYEVEDSEETLKFTGVRTDREDGSSTLVTAISGESDGQSAEITTTGTRENGKVMKIEETMKAGETDYSYAFEFAYDTTVDLPEYTIVDISQLCRHIESPYATFAEVMKTFEDENDVSYTLDSTRAYLIGDGEGRPLQFSAELSQEDLEEFEGLDFFDDGYTAKVMDILRRQTVSDCIDFSELILSEEELAALKGKKVGELLADGYEGTGWAVFEGKALLSFEKDGIDYDADAVLPEGFVEDEDIEFEDLADAEIVNMSYTSPSMAILPLE